jgi:hypothetical protein
MLCVLKKTLKRNLERLAPDACPVGLLPTTEISMMLKVGGILLWNIAPGIIPSKKLFEKNFAGTLIEYAVLMNLVYLSIR